MSLTDASKPSENAISSSEQMPSFLDRSNWTEDPVTGKQVPPKTSLLQNQQCPPNQSEQKQFGISAHDLKSKTFPPIKYVVEGYIVEGLTLLCGAPKIGKSYLCLDIACAVAEGGVAFGKIECEQGDVLYCALEENPRRLQSRMRQLRGDAAWSKRLTLTSDWPSLDKGCVEEIRDWCEHVGNPRMVIIDTLASVRGAVKDSKSAYYDDYQAMQELHTLAHEIGIAIVLVHHVRKMDADDPLNRATGTTGLTAAADTTLVLGRNRQGTTLYGRGRDIEEIETAVSFGHKTGVWTILGPVDEVRQSDQRKMIIACMKDAEGTLSPKEIAEQTGITNVNVRQTLGRMVTDGLVEKSGHGQYKCLPSTGEDCHNGHDVTMDDDEEDDFLGM